MYICYFGLLASYECYVLILMRCKCDEKRMHPIKHTAIDSETVFAHVKQFVSSAVGFRCHICITIHVQKTISLPTDDHLSIAIYNWIALALIFYIKHM